MKLNLGSGKRYIPGFIHIDVDDLPHIKYKHDIRSLPMIKNNSVDLIYFSHGIEYFDREEIKGVLAEWKRVLKSKGKLRLAVPDFESLVKVYLKYKKLDKVIGPLYGRWEINGASGKTCLYHKTVYNFKSIKKVLMENGFTNVKRYDWRRTIHKDYDDYSQAYIPHMKKDTGILISLNVEAIKK